MWGWDDIHALESLSLEIENVDPRRSELGMKEGDCRVWWCGQRRARFRKGIEQDKPWRYSKELVKVVMSMLDLTTAAATMVKAEGATTITFTLVAVTILMVIIVAIKWWRWRWWWCLWLNSYHPTSHFCHTEGLKSDYPVIHSLTCLEKNMSSTNRPTNQPFLQKLNG